MNMNAYISPVDPRPIQALQCRFIR